MYETVSPLGNVAKKNFSGAEALGSLEGKTICEIAGERGVKHRESESYQIINELLKSKYENIKIIPFTDFPFSDVPSWQDLRKKETARIFSEAFEKLGCDAVISGNGG